MLEADGRRSDGAARAVVVRATRRCSWLPTARHCHRRVVNISCPLHRPLAQWGRLSRRPGAAAAPGRLVVFAALERWRPLRGGLRISR